MLFGAKLCGVVIKKREQRAAVNHEVPFLFTYMTCVLSGPFANMEGEALRSILQPATRGHPDILAFMFSFRAPNKNNVIIIIIIVAACHL